MKFLLWRNNDTMLMALLIILGIVTIIIDFIFLWPLEEQEQKAALANENSNNNNNNNILIPGKVRKQITSLEKEQGLNHILSIFEEAGISLNQTMIDSLPSWEQVQQVVGNGPKILGTEKCADFRDKVPAVERMLGSAGMFNSGTNLVTHLLKQNCQIPERVEKYGEKATREQWGMRWQVPWGKHTPAHYRLEHATQKAAKINKEWILPIITIRNPYSWFKSMCKNGYTARWNHGRFHNCPNLKTNTGEWNHVSAKFADNREDFYDSLAHLWNDWYGQYLNQSDYPYLVVRMEDLVFYAKETTTAICECAGGKIRTDKTFSYIVDSAKADSVGHDHSTGLYQAWIKYSKPYEPMGGMSKSDYVASQIALNKTLMDSLGYFHPPPN